MNRGPVRLHIYLPWVGIWLVLRNCFSRQEKNWMPAPKSWDIVQLFHGHGMAPLYICLEFAMAPHFFYCHQCNVLSCLKLFCLVPQLHQTLISFVTVFFCIISSYCLEVHWLADDFQYWFMICCGNQTKLLLWSTTRTTWTDMKCNMF